jgi:hypothetical protein
MSAVFDRYRRKYYKIKFKPWFRGKSFTSDWTSRNFPEWQRILRAHRRKPARILEIGSWEGRSTIFFLRFLPHSTVTCVDTFDGGSGISSHDVGKLPGVEGRFDSNMRQFNGRVDKHKLDSDAALRLFADQSRQFDIVYIDGDHEPEQVLRDSLGAWELLSSEAVMIWDDYDSTPRCAIDKFLSQKDGQFIVLSKGHQIIILVPHHGRGDGLF